MSAAEPGLVIAARHSDLARLQAYMVGTELQRKNPSLSIQYHFRASLGDQNQDDPLWKMPEKGVFTEDFVADLETGKADLVVHSWKDLPTEERRSTELVACLPRADVRDVLLVRRDRFERIRANRTLHVLTSSPRRLHHLPEFARDHLPFSLVNVEFSVVRGNVPTRFRKLLEHPEADAMVMAKAALDRLLASEQSEFAEVRGTLQAALKRLEFCILPVSAFPSAAAQGAVVVEISKNRPELAALLESIHCSATWRAVVEERSTLKRHGGGCHQKIGVTVLPRAAGDWLRVSGVTTAGELLNVSQWRRGLDPRPGQSLSNPQARTNAEPRDLGSQPVARWPDTGRDHRLFDREPLDRSVWAASARSAKGLWVSRSTAWPDGLEAQPQQWVWTAGLATWRELSRRGVWVHGSAEGWGEWEPSRLEVLAGAAGWPLSESEWLVLTHDRSDAVHSSHPSTSGLRKRLATYRLKRCSEPVAWDEFGDFFWMSATTFEQALSEAPEALLKARRHASGPGVTARFISAQLSKLGWPGQPQVFLSREEWYQSPL